MTNKDKGVMNEHYQVACEKSSYDLRSLEEICMIWKSVCRLER